MMPLAAGNPTSHWVRAFAVWAALHGCAPDEPARSEPQASPPFDSMVEVPAGWFSMGCYRLLANVEPSDDADLPWGGRNDAGRLFHCVLHAPPGRRWVSAFAIDRFEVTNHEYVDCLRSGPCTRAPSMDVEFEYLPHGRVLLPARVTFEDAEAFCRWRGKRLPTDAEWQKAARGTDDRIYPWGDEPPSPERTCPIFESRDGRSAPCQDMQAHPIGHFPKGASPYGAQDMLDNASEWIIDGDMEALPVLESVDAYRNFRFSRRVVDGYTILEYDWNSNKFRITNPGLINPKSVLSGDLGKRPSPEHAVKGDTIGFGISEVTSGRRGSPSPPPHAGFRCVKDIPGPKPPVVREPRVGEEVLPFREPGYTPPGTPAVPASVHHKSGPKKK